MIEKLRHIVLVLSKVRHITLQVKENRSNESSTNTQNTNVCLIKKLLGNEPVTLVSTITISYRTITTSQMIYLRFARYDCKDHHGIGLDIDIYIKPIEPFKYIRLYFFKYVGFWSFIRQISNHRQLKFIPTPQLSSLFCLPYEFY